MPERHRYGRRKPKPIKTLRGIPKHETYRRKLESKWRRKGYAVRFC